ncbi:MAG: response regulator transcription factor [Anaerolineae bacterium]|nr:MAG: response regulator transcription factor [Anaerolineae bacterium]
MTTKLGVLLLIDSEILRAGFISAIDTMEGVYVTEFGGFSAARSILIEPNNTDVAILEIEPNTNEKIGFLTSITRANTRVPKILALTRCCSVSLVDQLLTITAMGIIETSISVAGLEYSIKLAHEGGIPLGPESLRIFLAMHQSKAQSRIVQDNDSRSKLTEKELKICILIAQGKSNREIGHSLFLEENTIKAYIRQIRRKLRVTNRVGLALFAIRTGDVRLEEISSSEDTMV